VAVGKISTETTHRAVPRRQLSFLLINENYVKHSIANVFVRNKNCMNTNSQITNDLHEALLRRALANGTQVDGFVEPCAIANNFARYFSEIYSPNNSQHASSLYTAAVFKLGSADQRGSATGSHGVRERNPKSSNCLHGF